MNFSCPYQKYQCYTCDNERYRTSYDTNICLVCISIIMQEELGIKSVEENRPKYPKPIKDIKKYVQWWVDKFLENAKTEQKD